MHKGVRYFTEFWIPREKDEGRPLCYQQLPIDEDVKNWYHLLSECITTAEPPRRRKPRSSQPGRVGKEWGEGWKGTRRSSAQPYHVVMCVFDWTGLSRLSRSWIFAEGKYSLAHFILGILQAKVESDLCRRAQAFFLFEAFREPISTENHLDWTLATYQYIHLIQFNFSNFDNMWHFKITEVLHSNTYAYCFCYDKSWLDKESWLSQRIEEISTSNVYGDTTCLPTKSTKNLKKLMMKMQRGSEKKLAKQHWK